MISRKSSSQLSTTSSSSSTKSSSPATSIADCDCEAKGKMSSAENSPPTRPLSVAIPADVQGPYCPRRPGLREILANTSPAPWTLAAFMAYLSNNHCLEILEFTMDAGRYRKHFQKMLSRATNGAPPAKDREYVQALWQRLVDAYIRPNGSREVNLPSDVRDPILLLTGGALPPAPQSLDEAVQKTYELMEESVLVPFLNSAYPQTALPVVSSYPEGRSTYEDRSSFQRRKRHTRSSPPPQSAVEPHAHSYTAPAFVNRKSAPSTLTTSLNKSRFSVKLSPTTSSPAGSAAQSNIDAVSDLNLTASGSNSAGQGLTDDTGSTDSPANESPMTPPTSPPMSDVSPKRDSGMWGLKKLGRLSGMKVGKKKSSGGIRSEEQ